MDKINLKVITPERVLFEGSIDGFIVKAKGENGEFAVLPNHIPMTATIGIGTLTLIIDKISNERKVATLFGGYVVIEPEKTTILTETAEWPDEIDIARAEAAKQRALDNLKKDNMDHVRASAALMRAICRIDIKKFD